MRADPQTAELALIAFIAATEAEPDRQALCARMMDAATATLARLPLLALPGSSPPEVTRLGALSALGATCAACAACARGARLIESPPRPRDR